jgi:hypothetical protein
VLHASPVLRAGQPSRRVPLFGAVLGPGPRREENLPGKWPGSLRRHPYASGCFRLDVGLSVAPGVEEGLRDAGVARVTGDRDESALSQAQVRRGLQVHRTCGYSPSPSAPVAPSP